MNDSVPQLPVGQLAEWIAAAGTPTPLLLDVREGWELAQASILLDGVEPVHIPMGELPSRAPELDPARPTVVICHHGARSQQCAMFLQQRGFSAVYNLQGGIDAWSRQVDPSVPRY